MNGFKEFIPQPVWNEVSYISVDSVNGLHFRYRDVKFRVTNDVLIIKTSCGQEFFNLDYVGRYYFEEKVSE